MRWPVLTALLTLSTYLGFVSIPSVAQQGSSIRVTVLDDHGVAVPAAEVHVVSLPDVIGLSTPKGTFSFKGVAPGTYQISATYPGFRDETVSDVVVVEGKTTDVNITLEQGPPKASDYRIHQTLEDVQLYSKPLSDVGQPPLCRRGTSTLRWVSQCLSKSSTYASGESLPLCTYMSRTFEL